MPVSKVSRLVAAWLAVPYRVAFFIVIGVNSVDKADCVWPPTADQPFSRLA